MKKRSPLNFSRIGFLLLSALAFTLHGEKALSDVPFGECTGEGRFMLGNTPKSNKTSGFLVVEKQDGKKSLIKLEPQSVNERKIQKKIGNKFIQNNNLFQLLNFLTFEFLLRFMIFQSYLIHEECHKDWVDCERMKDCQCDAPFHCMCATNGITYGNACLLVQASCKEGIYIAKDYQGRCHGK